MIYKVIFKFVTMVVNMTNRELEELKTEIELLREEVNTYIEYPEIFKEELIESSNKIDILINKLIINVY